MIISFEIDTKVLKILNVNLSQLIFVNLIYSKTSKTKLKEFIKLNLISKDDFEDLINKNIITSDSTIIDTENIKLDKEFIKSFKELSQDDFFDTFLETYPKAVTRPDGIRTFIRNNPKRCQQIYKQLVGNDRDKHLHILKCLLYEINDREITGQMQYMKTMNNWLTQEGWTYAEQRMMSDSSENINSGYGEDIM